MKNIRKYLIDDGRGTSSGNINRLSDTVFKFTEYNFLPGPIGDGINFDGHYTFYVDYTNMNWLVYKSSDYGGLTWTRPTGFSDFLRKKDFTEKGVKEIEHILADKLRGSYFYDGDHINHRGPNLIKGEDCKWSLICDWRGYVWVGNVPNIYSPEDTLALKELVGFERKYPDISIDFSKRISAIRKYEVPHDNLSNRVNIIPITINGIKGDLIHEIMFSKQTNTGLVINGKSYCYDSFSNGLSYYLEMLPTAIRNFAGSPFNL